MEIDTTEQGEIRKRGDGHCDGHCDNRCCGKILSSGKTDAMVVASVTLPMCTSYCRPAPFQEPSVAGENEIWHFSSLFFRANPFS